MASGLRNSHFDTSVVQTYWKQLRVLMEFDVKYKNSKLEEDLDEFWTKEGWEGDYLTLNSSSIIYHAYAITTISRLTLEASDFYDSPKERAKPSSRPQPPLRPRAPKDIVRNENKCLAERSTLDNL